MEDTLVQYLITDPQYYSSNEELFEKNLKRILDKSTVDIACFRDKTSTNFEELAKIFINVCKEYNIKKILINSDFKLAKQLGATGVHLTSQQFDKIKEAKDLDLYVIVSCHNLREIEKAQESYANAVTYSPIFETPKKGDPIGVNALKQALNVYEDIDIIALGGIVNREQVEQVAKTKAYGFASIRYFI